MIKINPPPIYQGVLNWTTTSTNITICEFKDPLQVHNLFLSLLLSFWLKNSQHRYCNYFLLLGLLQHHSQALRSSELPVFSISLGFLASSHYLALLLEL